MTQDYLLKQITSSLMYPESGLGKKFWDRVYERAQKEYGSINVPVNTFNKVWITPDEAIVYESGNTAYIVKSHLKVMLEEDYVSLREHTAITTNNTHTLTSKIVKEIILPELEREVNEGKNFALLRQIYSGMVLATWYKMALKESLLGKIYADKAKVRGVDQNPKLNVVIYRKYLSAFKKGVFNFIREDFDEYSRQVVPRKYFAGGWQRSVDHAGLASEVHVIHDFGQLSNGLRDRAMFSLKDVETATVMLQNLSPVMGKGMNRRGLFRGLIAGGVAAARKVQAQEPPVNGRTSVMIRAAVKRLFSKETSSEATRQLAGWSQQSPKINEEVVLETVRSLKVERVYTVAAKQLLGEIVILQRRFCGAFC